MASLVWMRPNGDPTGDLLTEGLYIAVFLPFPSLIHVCLFVSPKIVFFFIEEKHGVQKILHKILRRLQDFCVVPSLATAKDGFRVGVSCHPWVGVFLYFS